MRNYPQRSDYQKKKEILDISEIKEASEVSGFSKGFEVLETSEMTKASQFSVFFLIETLTYLKGEKFYFVCNLIKTKF